MKKETKCNEKIPPPITVGGIQIPAEVIIMSSSEAIRNMNEQERKEFLEKCAPYMQDIKAKIK
jgi:hypothetical protein